ncbi:MAG: STAS domain-containing protein [Shimia sp.]
MQVEIETAEAGGTVVAPNTDVTAATAAPFDAAVTRVLNDGATALVIDLAKVGFMASAGLRVILIAARRLLATQGKLVVCGPNDEVREVMEVSGVMTVVPVVGDRAEALAALG